MENLFRVPERIGFEIKAMYYLETGEIDRAAAVSEMWVRLYPNDRAALNYQMVIQRWRGDWEGVVATFAAMRRLDPLDGGLIRSMAHAHESLGNYDQALALWTEYVERFAVDVSGHLRLAAFHRRRGQLVDVGEVLERAIAVEPLSRVLAEELADLYLDIGRLQEARAGYDRLLAGARTPEQRAEALTRLTHYHHRRGEMADAIHAIEERTDIAGGRVTDVHVYLDAGRVDEAAVVLEKLRAGLQTTPSIYFLSAAVHVVLATDGVDAALQVQRQAAEAVEAGNFRGLRLALVLADLGLIRDRAGDYAGAAESYRAAIALSPDERFHRGAGRALRRASLLDEAEAELLEAIRLVPAGPHAHMEMGLLMAARGDIEAAAEHLSTALSVWANADDDFEPARVARAKLAELRG
jgi:tetratricopeptide (TPR) repeat protein